MILEIKPASTDYQQKYLRIRDKISYTIIFIKESSMSVCVSVCPRTPPTSVE